MLHYLPVADRLGLADVSKTFLGGLFRQQIYISRAHFVSNSSRRRFTGGKQEWVLLQLLQRCSGLSLPPRLSPQMPGASPPSSHTTLPLPHMPVRSGTAGSSTDSNADRHFLVRTDDAKVTCTWPFARSSYFTKAMFSDPSKSRLANSLIALAKPA